MRHSTVDAALSTEKLNLLNKQKHCVMSKVTTSVRSAVFQPRHRPTVVCHSFIALSIMRCLKSAQKFAVRVYQAATVVMETTQLVLSQFKLKTYYHIN